MMTLGATKVQTLMACGRRFIKLESDPDLDPDRLEAAVNTLSKRYTLVASTDDHGALSVKVSAGQ